MSINSSLVPAADCIRIRRGVGKGKEDLIHRHPTRTHLFESLPQAKPVRLWRCPLHQRTSESAGPSSLWRWHAGGWSCICRMPNSRSSRRDRCFLYVPAVPQSTIHHLYGHHIVNYWPSRCCMLAATQTQWTPASHHVHTPKKDALFDASLNSCSHLTQSTISECRACPIPISLAATSFCESFLQESLLCPEWRWHANKSSPRYIPHFLHLSRGTRCGRSQATTLGKF